MKILKTVCTALAIVLVAFGSGTNSQDACARCSQNACQKGGNWCENQTCCNYNNG